MIDIYKKKAVSQRLLVRLPEDMKNSNNNICPKEK